MSISPLEYHSLVQFKLLHKGATLPIRGTLNSGAFDIVAPEDGELWPGNPQLFGLGIAHQIHDDNLSFTVKSHASDGTHRQIEVPFRLQGILIPRSGLAARNKVRLFFAPCLIDHDYRGEIHVMMENEGNGVIRWRQGDRICQIAYVPAYMGPTMIVDSLSETERGQGGFGSTGGLSHG